MIHTILPMTLLAACTTKGSDSAETTDTTPTTTPSGNLSTISGEITWAIDFDAEAEASGLTDCSYSRTYTGVENASAPWACPACEIVYEADITMSEGYADCYSQISTTTPSEVEWLGYGGGEWYRGSGAAMTVRGDAELTDALLTVTQTIEGSEATTGTLTFQIDGSLTRSATEGDPMHGYTPPDTYACGWPKADPAAYDGPWEITDSGTMPDGWFLDVCDEPVRLHDFKGAYLVIEVSAMDCPPCQTAAEAEPEFEAALHEAGIEAYAITLLAPSLSDVAGTPTNAQLQQWIDLFSLTSPVLADRGWGYKLVGDHMGDDFGYPTLLVYDPDLNLIYQQVGFSTYDDILDAITTHAGG